MRFRTGLLIGLAVGYYYGAKAGRERYHQIDDYLSQLRSSPSYHQLTSRLTELADVGLARGRVLVDGVISATPPVGDVMDTYDYQGDPTLN
jgi:hypothetical protein